MIDINKLRLTDMNDFRLIPQLVEEMNTKFIKEEEKIICEKLFDLNIDKDILINQVQEIRRLNDIIEHYKKLEEQGLLLKLPFDVNSEVFIVSKQFILERNCMEYVVKKLKVKEFKYNCLRNFVIVCEEQIGGSICERRLFRTDNIFLTKEAAEKELKRLESAE